jgi:hypothetical protein
MVARKQIRLTISATHRASRAPRDSAQMIEPTIGKARTTHSASPRLSSSVNT